MSNSRDSQTCVCGVPSRRLHEPHVPVVTAVAAHRPPPPGPARPPATPTRIPALHGRTRPGLGSPAVDRHYRHDSDTQAIPPQRIGSALTVSSLPGGCRAHWLAAWPLTDHRPTRPPPATPSARVSLACVRAFFHTRDLCAQPHRYRHRPCCTSPMWAVAAVPPEIGSVRRRRRCSQPRSWPPPGCRSTRSATRSRRRLSYRRPKR